MKKYMTLLVKGMAGIGLAEGIFSLYHTNPPKVGPVVKTMKPAEAWLVDGAALSGDYHQVSGYLSYACQQEMTGSNG